jgi:glycosyltransferase involved in cell wall biosynthesis
VENKTDSGTGTARSPRRLLAVLPHLEGGGAQHVVLKLLRHLPRERFAPELALLRCSGELLSQVPADVPLHDLRAGSARFGAPALIRLGWRLRPAIVFSSIYYVNHLVLLLRPFLPRARIVVREAITVGAAVETSAVPRRLALLHRLLYRSADAVVVQCEAMGRDLERFGVPARRMLTIFNPVDAAALRAQALAAPDPYAGSGKGPHVLGVGRLVRQKGFDRLIRAFVALREREPGAQLWILGEDPGGRDSASEALRALREELGLGSCVHFMGYRSDVAAWLARADLFVLSSRYEGLPNVLLEALACGCPVVALDGPGGAREILERCGLPERLVTDLSWDPAWFRASGAARVPDLSAFALDAVVAAYARALEGSPS